VFPIRKDAVMVMSRCWPIAAITFGILVGSLTAVAPPRLPPEAFVPEAVAGLTAIRVIDGDTLEADVNLPWSITLRKQIIRCADFDAWESNERRKTVDRVEDEVARGKLATRELAELIAVSQSVRLAPAAQDRDSYGRLLGLVFIETDTGVIPLAEWMRLHDHVRR